MRLSHALLFLFLLPHGCADTGSDRIQPLKYKAQGGAPITLALYEAWFGHPNHIAIGYNSHDPNVIKSQIRRAKAMGISGFVVDWYGDREPFIDKSYALMQTTAAKENFQIAMMYDESEHEEGATDEALADFAMFQQAYLSNKAAGHQAYLTYEGRPVIFIFPKGRHTDWDRVKQALSQWPNPPFLIQENLPAKYPEAFDGFYAWVQPGPGGWAPDGSNWGEQYLTQFYKTMGSKYPDRIIVGGEWAKFDDSKASWSLNRKMSARCGQTYADTSNLWKKTFTPDNMLPFVMVETWNDHEEGTDVEDGLPNCNSTAPVPASAPASAGR